MCILLTHTTSLQAKKYKMIMFAQEQKENEVATNTMLLFTTLFMKHACPLAETSPLERRHQTTGHISLDIPGNFNFSCNEQVFMCTSTCMHTLLVSLLPFRIRLAAGFDDPDHPANFFFWFMHSVTLTLHGDSCTFIIQHWQ